MAVMVKIVWFQIVQNVLCVKYTLATVCKYEQK